MENDPLVTESDVDPEEVFEILELLGEGSYGKVYKAMNKLNCAIVAIKVIGVAKDTTPLKKEIDILKQCNSQFIVNYLGSYRKGKNAVWIVMEYCGAGSAADLMSICKRVLQEKEVAQICREVLQGLAYLHDKKLIHRDIKAGNILLNHKGQAKLADFGVSAQLQATMSKRSTVIGTPYWMAPEVLKENHYDAKADIWSLGITTIEMAAGAPPLSKVHPMRAIFMIPNNKPPALPNPSSFSEHLNDFIACCLVKKTDKRPSAKQLLEHPFIRNAPGRGVIQEMVFQAMPAIEDFRERASQDVKEDEKGNGEGTLHAVSRRHRKVTSGQSSKFVGEAEVTDENGTTVIHNGTIIMHDEPNDSTMIVNSQYGGVDSDTMVRHPASNSGTMVRHPASNSGTMIINRDPEESGFGIQSGTMIINRGTLQDSDTMIKHPKTIRVQTLEKDSMSTIRLGSLQKAKRKTRYQRVSLKDIEIPEDPSLEELQRMLRNLNTEHQREKVRLNEYYTAQKERLRKCIANLIGM